MRGSFFTIKMKNFLILVICAICGSYIWAKDPSTTITSDRMEMLRFKTHNEFTFDGNVEMNSKDFTGSCEHMWVYTEIEPTVKLIPLWCYIFPLKETPIQFHNPLESSKKSNDSTTGIGQIKWIIARKNVFLKTQDPVTKEVKQATSGKAVIYPREGKMVLTENPVVHCSIQGTFRGGKITFFKTNERVLVEDTRPGQRSTVTLGE